MMRKIYSLIILFTIFGFSNEKEPTYCRKNKKFILAQLATSKARLEDDVKTLTTAQINYKTSDSSWSIADCVEHIAIVEHDLLSATIDSIGGDQNPNRRKQVHYDDRQVMQMAVNRNFKVSAPESYRPSGQFGDYQGSFQAFLTARSHFVQFIQDNKIDLRKHFVTHPFLGTIDSYQMLLFTVGHTLRHVLQIEEIKQAPGFPW